MDLVLFEDMGLKSLTRQSLTFQEPLLEELRVSQYWCGGGVGDIGQQQTDGQTVDDDGIGPERFLHAPH